jgi:hypothetical protein
MDRLDVGYAEKRAGQALEALNEIASALADHGHHWTKRERWLYGRARAWLYSFCGAGSEA